MSDHVLHRTKVILISRTARPRCRRAIDANPDPGNKTTCTKFNPFLENNNAQRSSCRKENQLRRLALKYRLDAAEESSLLGAFNTPWAREIHPIRPYEQGSVVTPGDWALPKISQVAEIDAALKGPVDWKLVPIDQ